MRSRLTKVCSFCSNSKEKFQLIVITGYEWSVGVRTKERMKRAECGKRSDASGKLQKDDGCQ